MKSIEMMAVELDARSVFTFSQLAILDTVLERLYAYHQQSGVKSFAFEKEKAKLMELLMRGQDSGNYESYKAKDFKEVGASFAAVLTTRCVCS